MSDALFEVPEPEVVSKFCPECQTIKPTRPGWPYCIACHEDRLSQRRRPDGDRPKSGP